MRALTSRISSQCCMFQSQSLGELNHNNDRAHTAAMTGHNGMINEQRVRYHTITSIETYNQHLNVLQACPPTISI